MSPLSQKLLTAALHIMWETGHPKDERAVTILAERVPGFTPERYAEASRRAAEMDDAAYDLAAAWFAGRGNGPYPSAEVLSARFPGFAPLDYVEAVDKNVTWARK